MTGAVRSVLEEKVDTFFESGNGRVNWKVLFATNEVLWFSEKEIWGHLTETQRAEMDVYAREKFMAKYNDLIKQYY